MLMSIGSRVFGFLSNVLSSGVRMSASPRLLGRHSGGAGAGEEIQLGAGFSFVGNTLTYTAGGGATWGAITGTLSSQADLQAALNAKAASSHSHVSAEITDASVGGFPDAADVGKLVKFGMNGSLTCLLQFYIYDNGGPNRYTLIQHATALTQNREIKIPDKDGMIGILPLFADSTAAAAAVSIGDAWWDTTLNKARVRLT